MFVTNVPARRLMEAALARSNNNRRRYAILLSRIAVSRGGALEIQTIRRFPANRAARDLQVGARSADILGSFDLFATRECRVAKRANRSLCSTRVSRISAYPPRPSAYRMHDSVNDFSATLRDGFTKTSGTSNEILHNVAQFPARPHRNHHPA